MKSFKLLILGGGGEVGGFEGLLEFFWNSGALDKLIDGQRFQAELKSFMNLLAKLSQTTEFTFEAFKA
jgi:hypothetical protein